MKKVLFVLFAANCALSSMAQVKTAVTEFNIAGPYAVAAPFGVDTVNVQGQKFDPNSLMGAIALTSQSTGKFSGAVLPSLADSKSVGLLSFYLNNSMMALRLVANLSWPLSTTLLPSSIWQSLRTLTLSRWL